MELSLLLIRQILKLFLMVLCGIVLAKTGMVRQEECGPLSRMSVYLFLPCLAFSGFMTEWTAQRMRHMLLAILATVVIHIVFIGVTALLRKKWKMPAEDAGALIYTNAGAVLVPLVTGTIGSEYIVFTSAYMMVQNALLWTHAAKMIGGRDAVQPKKIVCNPTLIACAIGVVIVALGIDVPDIVVETTQTLGGCLAPVSMVQVGVVCAGFDRLRLRKMKTVFTTVVVRLAVYPLLGLAALALLSRAMPMEGSWKVLFVIVLAASGPSSVVVNQMAVLYGGDVERSSSLNLLTNAVCVLTLPVMTLLAQAVM